MYCEQCGKKIDDGARFCVSCGAPVTEKNEEPRQVNEQSVQSEGSAAVTDSNEVMQSGEQVEVSADGTVQTQAEASENEPVNTDAEEFGTDYSFQDNRKSFVAKVVTGVIAAIAVIAAVIAVFGFISSRSGGSSKDIPVAYVKDDELMIRLNNKNESYLISDDAYAINGYDEERERYVSTVQFSDDGKVVFFADDYSDGEFDLYYRKTNQKTPKGKDADEKGIKISGGVSSFRIAPDGSFVLYKKNDRLYYSDMKNERKISSDVSYFILNDDCNKVLYMKDDSLYMCGLGKKDEPQKIDGNVEDIEYTDGNFENIYYTKNDALYLSNGKKKEKITSDVYNTSIIGETMFLTKSEEKKYTFDDLFDDDCAASDEDIEYPSFSDFSIGFEFDDDAYQKARDSYNEKKNRDNLRERYKKNPIKWNTYTLYKVEDGKAVKIDEDLSNGYFAGQIYEKRGENGEISRIKMSTVTDYYDTVEKIDELTNASSSMLSGSKGEYYVLFENGKNLKLDVDCDDKWSIDVSEDGKYIYCIEDAKDGIGTLNRYKLSEKSISSKTKICDDVSDYTCYSDGNLIIRGEDSVLGFYNGKYTEISDEETYAPYYINGTLFYLDDYSDSSMSGTLMRFKNGKKEKLDDDVHDYVLRGDGLCYYIKDYSTKRSQGDLFKKNGLGKSKMIDTDVERFLD